MSDSNPTATTPISTAFEFQRTAIQQGQEAFRRGVEFQQRVNRAFVSSLDSQASAQRGTVELSRTATHAYLDAVAASVPGVDETVAEVREAVDQQFDALLESHAEAFDEFEQQLEEGLDTYDDATDEYIASLDEQIELLLEAHEDVEVQTLEAFRELQVQIEEFQGRVERQVEEVQQQVEEVQQQVADTAGQVES